LDTCYSLNADNLLWLPLPSMLAPKSRVAASIIDNKWVISGGYPSAEPAIQIYDAIEFTQADELPEHVSFQGHCQVTVDDNTLFFTATDNDLTTYFYDLATQKLEEIDPIPIGGSFQSACGLVTNQNGEKEVVVVHDELSAIFSFTDMEWRPGPISEGLVDDLVSVQLEDTFVVLGGIDDNGFSIVDSIYIFNTTSYEFDLMEQKLSDKKELVLAVAVPDEFVICN